MASGWAKDGAVQEQIDASVEDAIKVARDQLTGGESLTHCEECEEAITPARRKAIRGVCYCISCQTALEEQQISLNSFNRRGSKDSQLR